NPLPSPPVPSLNSTRTNTVAFLTFATTSGLGLFGSPASFFGGGRLGVAVTNVVVPLPFASGSLPRTTSTSATAPPITKTAAAAREPNQIGDDFFLPPRGSSSS